MDNSCIKLAFCGIFYTVRMRQKFPKRLSRRGNTLPSTFQTEGRMWNVMSIVQGDWLLCGIYKPIVHSSITSAAGNSQCIVQSPQKPLCTRTSSCLSILDVFCFCLFYSVKRYRKTMKERRNAQPLVVRCKLVLVGDVQCGKTAMLQVLAKDCYPEVSTAFLKYLK